MTTTIILVSQLPGLVLVVGAGPIPLSILLLLLLLSWILLLLLLLPRILLLILNIGVLLMLSFNHLLILLFTLKSSPGGKVTSLMVMSVITLAMIISWESIKQVAVIGKCTLVSGFDDEKQDNL